MVKIRKLWKGIESLMEAIVMEWSANKFMIMTFCKTTYNGWFSRDFIR
jgi:hypothetical protein